MDPESWVRVYSAAKIVLSIHYRSDDDRFRVYQASPRVFEAMSCGAFVLTDRQKDVLEIFAEGEHLAVFSEGGDLERQVLYFLNRAAERRRIAKAGRQEVLRHHTYEHRIEQMLKTLRSAGRPAYCRGTERPDTPGTFDAHGQAAQ
ncbi:MAG: glycosyltransferase [Desulfobacterales bacterium]